VGGDPAEPVARRADPITMEPTLVATNLNPPVAVRVKAATGSGEPPSTKGDRAVTPKTLAAVLSATVDLPLPADKRGHSGSAPPPADSAGGTGFSFPSALLALDHPLQSPRAFVRSRGDFAPLWRPCEPGTGPG
jgi:hypothetical protein